METVTGGAYVREEEEDVPTPTIALTTHVTYWDGPRIDIGKMRNLSVL